MNDIYGSIAERQTVYSKEKFDKMKLEHIKRKPDIDYIMAPERYEKWKMWKKIINISLYDVRNNCPMFLCHEPYTKEEMKIYDENGIKYCRGYCGDKCSYL